MVFAISSSTWDGLSDGVAILIIAVLLLLGLLLGYALRGLVGRWQAQAIEKRMRLREEESESEIRAKRKEADIAARAAVVKAREEMLARPRIVREPPTREEVADLSLLLDELNREWAARTGEGPFRWKLRLMKTLWGSCHWRKRVVTYNSDLARRGRDLVEYVVVHELTHFRVRNHGPEFQSLMDELLPGWRERRRRLNKGLA